MSSAPFRSLRREPATGSVWPALNRLLVVLIALIVAAVIGQRFLPVVSQDRAQAVQVEKLQIEIDKQKQLLTRHNREEHLLKNDPEYVGVVARDRLDLMKEGETVYRLDPPKADPAKMRLNR